MKVDLGIWDILTRLIIILLVAAGLLGVGIWYWPVITTNEKMRKEVMRLDEQIKVEEERIKLLKNASDALQHDTNAIERLARENFNYARTNEIVIRFETPLTNGSASH